MQSIRIHAVTLLRLSNRTRQSQVLFGRSMAMFNTSGSSEDFKSITYQVTDKVAEITLNRPHVMNAIDEHMPSELMKAVSLANFDDNAKVILLKGAGNTFCSGYDLKKYAEPERGSPENKLSQSMPWDPLLDYQYMSYCTDAYMSLWKSLKPVVCKIEGVAIGGGSDMALCCDVTFMAEDAKIGYPPSRVWGCPTTAMWVYRVGMEKAKRILFTGELLTGKQAAEMGLIGESVPADKLDETVDKFVNRIKTVPSNQLFFQKQVINQAVEQMGIFSTQRLATVFDGMTRHSPEGVAFQERSHKVGFKQAVKERDSGMETEWSDMRKY